MRPAFREHVRPHTRDRTGELLGGGSILSARWDHRLSRDLDVHLHLSTTEDGRKVLDRAAAACGGYRVDHPEFPRIEFEAGAILDTTVDALWARRTDSILRIEPERLRPESTQLPPIRWRPNRAGGGAGERERGTGVARGETAANPPPGSGPAAGASAAARRSDDR